ncbi:carboxypeptidase B-like [Bradysia coprophila]|uniref:carboxypeptidase B-like n=1 Tax=Bradysia coprophila TaxID=38358 RepID=UPI00187D97ED|nr:carboxypeptidase B-like [Bradysia coprophila]
MKLQLLFFATLISLTYCEQFSYEGYKVWSVTPDSDEQGRLLLQWEDNASIDFWEQISRIGLSSRIMAAPDIQLEFEIFLNDNKIKHKLIIDDVERVFQRERRDLQENKLHQLEPNSRTGAGNFNLFWTFPEINRYITQLTMLYGDLCHTETVGFSYEGRAIRALKIGRFDGTKPIVFFEAGVHAREWIAPMTALYLIEQLVIHHNVHTELQSIDVIVIPVLNPDGYEYSIAHQRLWRKTRRPNANSTCIGVDANRNFGHEWRVSTNPCSETYGGVAPFSEPEAALVRDLYARYEGQIKLHIGIHSYGQYFLYPWGYDFVNIDNWEEHDLVGNSFADAIYSVNGTTFRVGNAAMLLYTAFGGGSDYAAFQGIDMSATIELPGGGDYGFDLPASRIESVVQETWLGLEQLLHYVADVHGVV